jgi:hypothetical protein
MLFAPIELHPEFWALVLYDRTWDSIFQEEFDTWVADLRSKPQLLEAYKRYKELVSK